MKIFYDHTIFQQTYGGISRYFYEIVTRLCQYPDMDIHLFMGLFLNRYEWQPLKDRLQQYRGYRVPVIPRTGFLRRYVNDKAWKLFQSRFSENKGTDSLYHPTYYDFSGLAEAKTVFTVYDFAHERLPHFFPGDQGLLRLKRKAFDRADALICISESTKNDLLSLYEINGACKVKVIHLGFSDMSKMPDTDLPAFLPERPFFLFVGPRHAYKNFLCLLEAFALSPEINRDFSLVCCGGVPFSKAELKYFDDLRVTDKVFYCSGGDDVLSALFKKAVALVYPSFYEGFGIPPLEAMSCGCPVIAGNSSSIPEVVGDAAFLFDPASKEALAAALKKVAFDDGLRASLKASGQLRCRLFSWDRCAEETAAVYRDLGGV